MVVVVIVGYRHKWLWWWLATDTSGGGGGWLQTQVVVVMAHCAPTLYIKPSPHYFHYKGLSEQMIVYQHVLLVISISLANVCASGIIFLVVSLGSQGVMAVHRAF